MADLLSRLWGTFGGAPAQTQTIAGLRRDVPELQNSHGGSVASGIINGIAGLVTYPRDAYQGTIDPRSEAGIERAYDAAGALTLGSLGAGVPMQAGETLLAAGIPRQAFRPDGVELGWVMRDVEPGAITRGSDKQFNRLYNSAVNEQDWTEVELPIRSMIATQKTVNPDFVESAARRSAEPDDGFKLPAVVKKDGKYYVTDGHHRLTATADQADTARVRLIDMDAARYGGPDPRQMDLRF